jgi:predicted RNA-binding Zn-ribbon protein involved in translation (DUF1610 family)
MNWIDQKYINLVSNRFNNYKRKSGTLFNFSCPLCGDSATNKNKARGYIYEKKGNTIYHCHNCGITNTFDKFLYKIDQSLHHEYVLEKLKEQGKEKRIESGLEDLIAKLKVPLYVKTGPLSNLKKISQLKYNHTCKIFIESRKIPNLYHAKLFYCPKFFTWVNSFIPNKFSENSIERDEPRLIIPFINNDKLHAFQGRALSKTDNMRYITIVYDDEIPKIYGLDKVDLKKKTYVFEGPIDSMFIPNSIATAGGDLISAISDFPKENLVIVYDNEPRSIDTRKKIDKAIMNGYNVCIWPSNMMSKDVNDMILSGLSSDFIKYVIDTHTYRDLKAKFELNNWSKA